MDVPSGDSSLGLWKRYRHALNPAQTPTIESRIGGAPELSEPPTRLLSIQR